VKGRTVFKWATGVVAIVVLIGVGAVVLLFVVGFMSLKKGEKHRREFQAELDSARWDALLLLERSADPNRAGADGMTFGKNAIGPPNPFSANT
jgi:hypothetical protein